MHIGKVLWRNFASYGNKLQEIDFEDIGMRLLIGENGSGKSTISDVIIFSLYGKLANKRLRDIVNRFNGNLYTKIEFTSRGNNVIIERGISPGFLKLYVNGSEYDQANKRNVDQYIEEELIGIPFYVYNNLITLSINDFKSFLSMGIHDKRQIIDKIFSLQIINTVRTLIRDELKRIYDDSANLSKEVSALELTIISSEKELEKLKKQIESDNADLKKDIQQNIESYNEKLGELATKLSEVQTKNTNAETKIRELTETLSSHVQTKKSIEEKKKLYENKKCPLCESDLNTEFHQHILGEYLEKELNTNEVIEVTKQSIAALKKLKGQLDTMAVHMQTKKAEFNTLISNYNKKLKELEYSTDNSLQTQSIQRIIDENKKRKIGTIKKKDQTDNKVNFFKILEDIYGENGVKQLALQKILPTLNAEIRKVMAELRMDYKVVFNINFDAELSHLGYEVATQQVSTGERKKIDFAVLIALIRLMKYKFPTINMIFLDELFSSLDNDSVFHVIKILSQTSKDLKMNIFVVNHAPLPEELFDYKIIAKKVSNFSSLEITKIS